MTTIVNKYLQDHILVEIKLQLCRLADGSGEASDEKEEDTPSSSSRSNKRRTDRVGLAY